MMEEMANEAVFLAKGGIVVMVFHVKLFSACHLDFTQHNKNFGWASENPEEG
jgi:hypothetical protein